MADLSTSFAGTNGSAAPSPWTIVSGTATIQNNAVTITSPATQWNAGELRANQNVADFSATVTINVPVVTGASPRVNFRWNPGTGNGYRVIVGNEWNELQLLSVTNYSETVLATVSNIVMNPGVDYKIAIEATGGTLNVWRWLATGSKPTTPLVTVTDATYTTGDVSLVIVTATTAAATAAWHDFGLTDYNTAPPPPPATLPTDFTGNNGDTWPAPWTAIAGTHSIENNAGQQLTSATQYDTARARANMAYADQRYDARFMVPTVTSGALALDIRSDGTGGAGYRLIIGTSYGQVQPVKVTNYAESPLAPAQNISFVAGVWYRVAAESNGSLLRFKLWADGQAEPSTWLYTLSDTTYTSGDIMLSTKATAAVAATGLWDGVSVSQPTTDSSAPTATLLDPTPAGQTAGYEHIQGMVTLQATAQDDALVQSVAFYDGDPRAGGALISITTSLPYQSVWNTCSSVNGPHTLFALATDQAGNQGVSQAVAVVVNNSGVWAPGTTRCWPVTIRT